MVRSVTNATLGHIVHLAMGSWLKVMLNKNTLGVKKVRGLSEAALQIGMYDQKR